MEKLKRNLLGFLRFIGVILLVVVALGVIYYGLDFMLKDVLSHLSTAVLSNFIVFVLVIAIVMHRNVKPAAMLEKAKEDVVNSINVSETVKEESQTKLSSIEESISHIEDEINLIISKATENAKLVGDKILQDGEKTALIIKENTDKAIENSRNILRNELLRRASLASVEVARAHIISELNSNQGLHDKLIDESIEAIEGANQ